ncbi:unnamed protein product [Sphagnum jensenii]|uniref:Uncharacterized protein n=1 Tax=Sphagnum jensenii TaxID=128206 RepID=A0ABP1BX14_9BRYO
MPASSAISRPTIVTASTVLFSNALRTRCRKPEKVDILGAIQFAVLAWNYEVKPTTIANYFLHCKIWSTEQAEAVENITEDDLVDHEVIADLQSQI